MESHLEPLSAYVANGVPSEELQTQSFSMNFEWARLVPSAPQDDFWSASQGARELPGGLR